jgi:hypothetical protein
MTDFEMECPILKWTLFDRHSRPDLNRGWRFCRFRWVLYRVDSSCSLVSGVPRFSLVFGRSWTEVGLKFSFGLAARFDAVIDG